MQYVDKTPDYYVEKEMLLNIFLNLKDKISDDYTLFVKCHSQEPIKSDGPYAVIITSSETHKHVPIQEIKDDNCFAILMHYPPIKGDSYDINNFVKHEKLHHIPLGPTTKFIESALNITHEDIEKDIDVCFIGQFDPYRRSDFYNACEEFAKKTKLSTFFEFYNGWNKGFSANKFAELMARSKIALVPWGSASRTTFRFYEAALSRCNILCNKQYECNFSFLYKYTETENDEWNPLNIERQCRKILESDFFEINQNFNYMSFYSSIQYTSQLIEKQYKKYVDKK